jgi:alkylation response protein AidB-like acyl-CoA dehydrogenase
VVPGQALLAAESLGAVESALEMAVQYAKERFTFGRAIGSYQAIKHGLTEVLRRQENARSLLYYAGWAFDDRPSSSRWRPARRARRRLGSWTSPRARTSSPTADRRDMGARRAAVLPSRAAVPAPARRSGRRDRPRGRRAARGGLIAGEQLRSLSRRSSSQLADGQEVQRAEESAGGIAVGTAPGATAVKA